MSDKSVERALPDKNGKCVGVADNSSGQEDKMAAPHSGDASTDKSTAKKVVKKITVVKKPATKDTSSKTDGSQPVLKSTVASKPAGKPSGDVAELKTLLLAMRDVQQDMSEKVDIMWNAGGVPDDSGDFSDDEGVCEPPLNGPELIVRLLGTLLFLPRNHPNLRFLPKN